MSRSPLQRRQGWPRERRPPLRAGETSIAEFPGDVGGGDQRPGRPEHLAGPGNERASGHGTNHGDRAIVADVDDLPRRPEAASSARTPGRAPGSGTPLPEAERTFVEGRDHRCREARHGAAPSVRGTAPRWAKGPAQQRPDRHGDRHPPGPAFAPPARQPADHANSREPEHRGALTPDPARADRAAPGARIKPRSRPRQRSTTIHDYRPTAAPPPRVDHRGHRNPDRAADPTMASRTSVPTARGGRETIHGRANPLRQQHAPAQRGILHRRLRVDVPRETSARRPTGHRVEWGYAFGSPRGAARRRPCRDFAAAVFPINRPAAVVLPTLPVPPTLPTKRALADHRTKVPAIRANRPHSPSNPALRP